MSEEAPLKVLQDRYEIRSTIGEGGSGIVFKAWDRSLQRHVAVKRFHTAQTALKDTNDQRAWREAMTTASMQHPNILTIYDFGIDDEGPFVIMEFLEGETLEKTIAAHGPYTLKNFRDAVHQTLEALIAAHHTGLIHRDIKPHNIMVIPLASGARQYKVLDFGLAKILTQPTVQTIENNCSIYGSVFYIAPEQFSRQPVDERTDLYAMGCVYYHMLTGKNAFEGASIAEIIAGHLKHRVVPLHKRRPDLPAAICDWVMKLFSAHPDDRFRSAAEALAAFNKVQPTTTIRMPSKSGSTHAGTGPIEVPANAAMPPRVTPPADPPKKKGIPVQVIISGVTLLIIVSVFMVRAARSKKPAPARRVATAPAKPSATPRAAPAPAASVPAPEPEPPAAVAAPKPAPKPAPVEPPPPPTFPPRERVWDTVVYDPANLAELQGKVGEMLTIKGRVQAIRRGGGMVYFDFNADRKLAASIVFDVPQEQRAMAYDRLKTCRNQMVRVRGQLESADGQLLLRTDDVGQLDELPPIGY